MAEVQPEIVQSRIGKRPVELPAGVEVRLDGRKVSVKGPKGSIERVLPSEVEVVVEDRTITVKPARGAGRSAKQFQGLARSLINGMVEGTSKGFDVSLDLVGVGYRAELNGQSLKLALGLSHPVVVELPSEISARIETIDEGGLKKPRVHLNSHDKAVLGQIAAHIRSFRPPEPYKGKGVRYTGEHVREKAGKSGGKK
ncbi:MAG: 50S ribosomal protein L6 [Myxococcales bacterium]|nr:50S ribosomal protein L6 [Myxococcales bacterium]